MPTGLQIGPLYIRFYGVIIMVGALAAAWLAERRARNREFDGEIVWDALIWVLIGGILGARIWHILTPPPSMVEQGITTIYYFTHPLDALAIWRGGLGIPGAVIGGVIALYFFCRQRGLDVGVWVDIAAPSLALGQAIGRWGNFINQEIYGMPTDLPWGIFIEPQNRLPGFQDQSRFHPLFLYESLWNFANMAFLLWLSKRYSDRLKSGDLFFVYLITYPLGRIFLDFIRLDASQVAGFNANQTFMVLIVVAAVFMLYIRHRQKSNDIEGDPSLSSDAVSENE